MAHPVQETSQVAALGVSRLLRVFSQVSFQVHVTFRVPAPEMVYGRFMVMGQRSRKPFQDIHPFQSFQVFLSASHVKHVLFRAEIPYIRLFPVCFYGGRVRTDFMGIQKAQPFIDKEQ